MELSYSVNSETGGMSQVEEFFSVGTEKGTLFHLLN